MRLRTRTAALRRFELPGFLRRVSTRRVVVTVTALFSADEHAQTSVSEHGDRHSPPAGAETAQKRKAGLLKLDAQPSAPESVFPRARHGRSLPRSGELAFRETYAASGPNREPGNGRRGIRRLRISLPARQWRLRDACGLSRLDDLVALWSQAHMPSCNRQVTSTSVHMAKPGSASAPHGHAPL